MIFLIKGRYLAAVWCLLMTMVLYTKAYASSYTPTSSHIRLLHGVEAAEPDVLSLSPKNAAGISINRFNEFSLRDRPLKLYAPTGSEPEVIVIVAPNLYLGNTLEPIGFSSNIIFLSEGPEGSITCAQCTLKNADSASFIVTKNALEIDSGGRLGLFSVARQGSVVLQGMSVPGALTVDVLAGGVQTSGVIDLHTYVNRALDGTYQQVDGGRLTMASAVLNIMVGDFSWHHDTRELDHSSIVLDSGNASLDGEYRAAGVKVTLLVDGQLPLLANIDTRSDLVGAVRRDNQEKLAKEQISITNLSGGLNINSHLSSRGDVAVNAADDLNMGRSAVVHGGKVDLVAKDTLMQRSQITAVSDLGMAAADIINEARVVSSGSAELFADNTIINHIGGELLADKLKLYTCTRNTDGVCNATGEHTDTLILNGSRTPYYVSARLMGQQPLNIPNDYLASVDHARLGVYYTAELDEVQAPNGAQRPQSSLAHMHARQIEISTHAFENINPYYEKVDLDEPNIILDSHRHRQISVRAEESLHIQSDMHILNASAFLGVESQTGLLQLDTGVLINERYRIHSLLTAYDDSDPTVTVRAHPFEGAYTTVESVNSILTAPAVYSPPGMLFSMGNLHVTAEYQAINSVGYLEVYGDAVFYTPHFFDMGFARQSMTQTHSLTTYSIANLVDVEVGQQASQQAIDPRQMDSLFFVHGEASVLESEDKQGVSFFGDYSPFKSYLSTAITPAIELREQELLRAQPAFHDYVSDSLTTTFDINWDEGVYAFYTEGDVHYSTDRSTDTLDFSMYIDEEKEYSIFDTLKAVWQSLSATLTSIVDEVNWWRDDQP